MNIMQSRREEKSRQFWQIYLIRNDNMIYELAGNVKTNIQKTSRS